MKIQEKPDYLIFADSAKKGEVNDFPDVSRGWGVTIEQTGSKPPMEWMNGAFNRIDKNMLYLLQQGVPDWSESVKYPANAIIKYNGIIYIAKVENESANPISNVNKWTKLISDASTEHKGIVQLSSAIDSTSEALAATPKAVKTAVDKANSATTVANTAKANAATAQTKADSAYTLANTANTTANTAKSIAETDASTTVKGRVQLNSAVNSTVENQAATPKAVKTAYDLANKSVGIGQKWQNVKASRTTNTVYTNTTGKPIYVYIQVFNDLYPSATECTLILGSGVELDAIGGGVGHSGAWKSANLSVIIPENETYKVITRDGNIKTWAELR